MDASDIAAYVEVAPDQLEFEEHILDEQYIQIDNYYEDLDVVYRVHASIPNTCVFHAPTDVVPPCVSCSVPMSIKKTLPPDYQLVDAINVRVTVEVHPRTDDFDIQGVKAFWIANAKNAMKKEIDCVVYKSGATRCKGFMDGSDVLSNDSEIALRLPEAAINENKSVTFTPDTVYAAQVPAISSAPLVFQNDFSNIPQVCARPKLLYFFEGDEPLLDSISVQNCGNVAVVYRISSSTPSRFSINVLGGLLEPGVHSRIAVELKSFPLQLPTNHTTTFATFYVDFAAASNDFSANNINGFFSSLGNAYIRKTIESRAVKWDDRHAVETRLKSEIIEDAFTEHDCYNIVEDILTPFDNSARSAASLQDYTASSVQNTPSDGVFADNGRVPRAIVTPKCLYFLEGDEPMSSSICVQNTGARAVLFRVNNSTPNRFHVSATYGELEPSASFAVNVELKSFPIQLPEGEHPLAHFSVDFILREASYDPSDKESFWNAAGDTYLRKSVPCFAFGYEDRGTAEAGRQSFDSLQAATEYNGYTITSAAAHRARVDTAHGDEYGGHTITSDIGSPPAGTVFAITLSKQELASSEDTSDDAVKDVLVLESTSASESLNSLKGKDSNTINSSMSGDSGPSMLVDNSILGRPALDFPQRHSAADSAFSIPIVYKETALVPENAASASKPAIMSFGTVAMVSVAATKARPAALTRRHSVDVPDLPSEDEKRKKSARGLESVISEFSKRSVSGNLGLKRRASVAASITEVADTEGMLRAEMSSVLSEFSKKLGSGNLKLRRSSIVSQAAKTRRQREEEASGEFKGVLGELRYLFSTTGAPQKEIKEKDLMSYNTKGEVVRDEEIKGAFTVMSSFDVTEIDESDPFGVPAHGCSADSVEEDYTTPSNSRDDSEEIFPGSPFVSPLADKQLFGNALHQTGMFNLPPVRLSSTKVKCAPTVGDHIELIERQEKIIEEKDSCLNDLNEQLDLLVSVQQTTTRELEVKKAADIAKIRNDQELKIISLREQYERKLDVLRLDMELLKEQHQLNLQAVTNRINTEKKETIREKDAELRQLRHELEDCAALQALADEEKAYITEAETRRLTSQFEAEMKSLRRKVDDVKQESDLAITNLNEQHEASIRMLILKHESEVFKLRQQYDVDTSKLALQLEELRRAKEQELLAVKAEYEAKIKSLSTHYELEMKILKQRNSELEKGLNTGNADELGYRNDETRRHLTQQENEIASLKSKIVLLKEENGAELNTMSQRYEEEIAALLDQKGNEFLRLRTKQELKIDKLHDLQHQSTIELQEDLEQKEDVIALLNQQHENKLQSVVQEYESRLTAAFQQHIESNGDIAWRQREEMVSTKPLFQDTELKALKKQYEAHIQSLTTEYDATIKCLRQDIESQCAVREQQLRDLREQKESKMRDLMNQHELTLSALTKQLEIFTREGNDGNLPAPDISGPIIAHLKEMIQQQDDKISELEAANRQLECKYSKYTNQQESERRSLSMRHEAQIESVMHQLSELVEEHERFVATLKHQHETEIRLLNQRHTNRISSLNLHNENKLDALKRHYEDDISDLNQSHEESLQTLLQQKDDDVRKTIRQYESKQRALQKQIEQLMEQKEADTMDALLQLEKDLDAQARRHEQEIAIKNKQHAAKLSALTQQNEMKILSLKQELDDLCLTKEAKAVDEYIQVESKLRIALQDKDAEIASLISQDEDLHRQQDIAEAAQAQLSASEFRFAKKKHEAELAALAQENLEARLRFEAEVDSLKEAHENEIRMIKKRHEADLNNLEHEQQSAVIALSNKLEDEILSNTNILESQRLQREAEIKALLIQHNVEIDAMKKQCSADTEDTVRNLEQEHRSKQIVKEETIKIQYESQLTQKEQEIEEVKKNAKASLERAHIASLEEKEQLINSYEAQLAVLKDQMGAMGTRLSHKDSGIFMTQSNEQDSTEGEKPRSVDLVSVSPRTLSFCIGEVADESSFVLHNKGTERVAFRTRVTAQNIFIVKGGDGVLEANESRCISVTAKPTCLYDSSIDVPAVKFAVELLEVDNAFEDVGDREYWKEHRTFCVRRSISTSITVAGSKSHAQSDPGNSDSAQELRSVLNKWLVTGSSNTDSLIKNDDLKNGDSGRVSAVGMHRPIRVDHTLSSRPRGRVLRILVASLSNGSTLAPEEYEQLQEVRNSMPSDRWEEWIRYAKAERQKMADKERAKMICELDEREFREEVLKMSGLKSRRPSPARSTAPSLNDIEKPVPLRSGSPQTPYHRQPARYQLSAAGDAPSNQLQWSDVKNAASPPVIPTRPAPTSPAQRRPQSPLIMAKALVSTIHSGDSDINDIESKLSVLTDVVNILDLSDARDDTDVSENQRPIHRTGSGVSGSGSLNSSRHSNTGERSVGRAAGSPGGSGGASAGRRLLDSSWASDLSR